LDAFKIETMHGEPAGFSRPCGTPSVSGGINPPARSARRSTGNWDQVSDAQALMQDQKVDLAELEMELSTS
jgi:hypothetical protein